MKEKGKDLAKYSTAKNCRRHASTANGSDASVHCVVLLSLVPVRALRSVPAAATWMACRSSIESSIIGYITKRILLSALS